MKPDKDKLKDFLERLRETQLYIIVEGKHDKQALVRLGVNPNLIICLGMPLFKLAEDISKITRRAIILTDLDSEGKRLYSELKRDLNRVGVQVDTFFRESLFKYSELSHIEGIYTYFRNLGLVD